MSVAVKRDFSQSDNIPQMEIFNLVITILKHFCSFVKNWSIASGIKPNVIKGNVALLIKKFQTICDSIFLTIALQKQVD